ncbi:MAG: insulinase family protein [Syntrophales bacterium]|nr:insulinase family protein [Syntrophales bacterium]MCU0583491.1 insulinase family protein [Syntrophales bacterium]
MQTYRKTVLSNGIKVITEEIRHVRSASIGAWVRCGSRHEDERINGTAHFIEHMLFKGTARRSAFDIASDIDSVGGVMNAFTGKELTAFYVKVPDYHLTLAIDLLADIFNNSLFTLDDIDKEKSVVLQEISMVEDTPDEYIHDIFEKHFWDGHSLGMPVLGTKDSVDAFDRGEVLKFFEERYRGDNLVIAAVGNLEHEKMVDLVANLFGALPPFTLRSSEEKPRTTSRLSCIEKDLEQLHLVVGTPAPATLDNNRFAGILMNSVFGGSMSSRLFQEIREKRGLAYAVRSYIVSYRDTGMLNIYVGTSKDKTQEVIDIVLAEMRRMKTERFTDKELQSAKELIKGNLLLSMESTDNRMQKLATNEIYFGRNVPPEEIVGRIEAVTAEDILSLSEQMFTRPNLSMVFLGDMAEAEMPTGTIDL